MQFLAGYKTYAVAAAMLAYAALGYFHPAPQIPAMSASDAIQLVMAALAVAGVRNGVTTEIQNVLASLGAIAPKTADQAEMKRNTITSTVVNLSKRNVAAIMLTILLLPLVFGTMYGCAAISSPASAISDAQAALNAAELGYAGICAAVPKATFCSVDAMAKAAQSDKLAQDAINTVNAALVNGDPNIDVLIANAQKLEADVEAIFNDAKSQARMMGVKAP